MCRGVSLLFWFTFPDDMWHGASFCIICHLYRSSAQLLTLSRENWGTEGFNKLPEFAQLRPSPGSGAPSSQSQSLLCNAFRMQVLEQKKTNKQTNQNTWASMPAVQYARCQTLGADLISLGLSFFCNKRITGLSVVWGIKWDKAEKGLNLFSEQSSCQ